MTTAAREARGTLTRPSTPVGSRSERAQSQSRSVGRRSAGPAELLQSRRSVLQLRIAARGGATSPQGTNVNRSWVDVFDRRGRRSPLVSRPEGRPRAYAEQGRSFRRTAEDGGQRGVRGKGNRRNWTLSPRCGPVVASRASRSWGTRQRPRSPRVRIPATRQLRPGRRGRPHHRSPRLNCMRCVSAHDAGTIATREASWSTRRARALRRTSTL
jgi:hypothetical protein